MTKLKDMLASQRTTITEIAAWLDALSAAARLEAAFSLGRSEQRVLFQRAGNAAFGLEHYVPRALPAVRAVHHKGKNTLPLPGPYKFFEKRFARPNDSSERLFGYNVSAPNRLIGPGYFVTVYTRGNPAWAERGPIVVDYYQMPDGDVPSGWPPVVPNSVGLQKFIHKGTRDFMRKVSEHVSIGAAYKGEKALDHYFILVRQDT